MSNNASVLTTVNAPYHEKLNEAELVYCLVNQTAAKNNPGHVSSFFGDLTPDTQKQFAMSHGISIDALTCMAKAFSSYSGESYPLSTRTARTGRYWGVLGHIQRGCFLLSRAPFPPWPLRAPKGRDKSG